MINDQSSRLREARIKAGYTTASEAARAFGWNENTYRSHENGERGIKSHTSTKYATAFGVSIPWLMTGDGNIGLSHQLPVEGAIGKGGNIFSFKNKGVVATFVFITVSEAFCYWIVDDNMRPRYASDDMLIFVRRERSLLKSGMEGIIWRKDESRYVFGTVYFDDTDKRIEPIGAKIIRDIDLESFCPVLAVVRSGLYMLGPESRPPMDEVDEES